MGADDKGRDVNGLYIRSGDCGALLVLEVVHQPHVADYQAEDGETETEKPCDHGDTHLGTKTKRCD